VINHLDNLVRSVAPKFKVFTNMLKTYFPAIVKYISPLPNLDIHCSKNVYNIYNVYAANNLQNYLPGLDSVRLVYYNGKNLVELITRKTNLYSTGTSKTNKNPSKCYLYNFRR